MTRAWRRALLVFWNSVLTLVILYYHFLNQCFQPCSWRHTNITHFPTFPNQTHLDPHLDTWILHPDAACIVAGDFNKANLKKLIPNFHQHISCPTRGLNTLDHCYTQFKNAYKAHSLPAFGKSDHAAIFLTPDYKQRILQEPPVEREVTRWSSHSEATLQASLDDVDWDMFRASSSDVSEFTEVALSFVNTLTEQATETVTIKTFSNQKPWVDRTIRDAVNHRTAAYNAGILSGNMSEYKSSCYALHRAVRAAKRRYSERIESHFQLNDSRRMWQGLKTICSSGNNNSVEVRADPLLAVELNNFYGRFECNGGATLPSSASANSRQSSDDHVFTVSEDDVRRELRRVNVRKAAGPDGITGRVLRSCADQLAGLFTSIFNESLATSVVPTPFKKSVIIPVPKNSKPSCLNDYRPVALTSTVMKVFERLLKKHICSSIPATLDPLQFAYRPNRSTDDAISQVLHSSLTHIDSKIGNYVRLLFIDYSSAFNTIVPTKLAVKLSDLGLNTSLCDWIQDFLTARPQVVKDGSGSTLPSLQGIYLKRCRSRAAKIIKDSNHPGNHLFRLLPSGKRFRSLMAKTERLRKSFFPQAIRLLNTNSVP